MGWGLVQWLVLVPLIRRQKDPQVKRGLRIAGILSPLTVAVLLPQPSAPSKTAGPAKNWGLTSLSQGAAIPAQTPRTLSPVDRAVCPQCFRPVHSARRLHSHRCAIAGQRNTHDAAQTARSRAATTGSDLRPVG